MSQNRTTEIMEQLIGSLPSKRINNQIEATPDTGYKFTILKALNDTVINTATGNIANFNGATILAGDLVFGRWTSITLTSGDLIAYQGV